jgi:glucose dehydrogenase
MLDRRGSRRAMLAWAASGAALGVITLGGMRSATGLAQEEAPASPVVQPTALGGTVPDEVANHAADWPMLHGNYAATRAAVDSPINSETVAGLEVAWRFPLTAQGGYGAIACNPVVVGDVIYIQDMAFNVFALDRTSGAELWRKEINIPASGPNGVAVGYGLVFAADILGTQVLALDAATGEELWRSDLSANPNVFIFMQPIVYDNVLYVGTSSATYVGGAKGAFFALDAGTGAVLWQFETTTDNLWGNARINSGGSIWYGPSVDVAGNVYVGIGNPAPWPGTPDYPNGSSRPGDNLYTSSMVSLDTSTGSLRWYVQARPHDLTDQDFQNTPILATVAIDGGPTPLAIGSGKAGVVIAAHAETGDVIWRTPVGEHTESAEARELPLDEPVSVAPGAFGGVLTPPAFANDTVFVPVINWPMNYTGVANFGPDTEITEARGAMVALDAATGAVKWQTEVPTFFAAGATVANDVVFGAGLDGIVRGFDTSTGEEIWQFQAAAGVNSTLAIAGDLLLVPAGGFFITALDSLPAPANELIALRLSGSPAATPVATSPRTEATPIAHDPRRVSQG